MKLYRLLRNFRHMSMEAYRCHLMAGIGRHWEVMMGYKGERREHGNSQIMGHSSSCWITIPNPRTTHPRWWHRWTGCTMDVDGANVSSTFR